VPPATGGDEAASPAIVAGTAGPAIAAQAGRALAHPGVTKDEFAELSVEVAELRAEVARLTDQIRSLEAKLQSVLG
jgi:hypothetical protein